MINAETLDAVLPQTQCGLCGYAGCRPYAEAMMIGVAGIDRCPPGGLSTLHALGALLQMDSKPYEATLLEKVRVPAMAVIREDECIGCTKCIQACPVDAVVGAAKWMHIILQDECTGCGLCVEPCPVDCIDMIEQAEGLTYDPTIARQRHHAKQVRLLQIQQAQSEQYRTRRRVALDTQDDQQAEKKAKQTYILEAMMRVKAKRPL